MHWRQVRYKFLGCTCCGSCRDVCRDALMHLEVKAICFWEDSWIILTLHSVASRIWISNLVQLNPFNKFNRFICSSGILPRTFLLWPSDAPRDRHWSLCPAVPRASRTPCGVFFCTWAMKKKTFVDFRVYRGFPKMVGFPNKPMGFPIQNDYFGVFWVPPFEETPI